MIDFITIIPNSQLNNIHYVTKEIIKNRLISIKKRNEIREYGFNKFGWNVVVEKFINIINNN